MFQTIKTIKKGNYKVLIAASTHSGEDEIIAEAYKKLKNDIKDLKMILAPRHLTRMDEGKNALFGLNYGFST